MIPLPVLDRDPCCSKSYHDYRGHGEIRQRVIGGGGGGGTRLTELWSFNGTLHNS